MKLKRYFFSFFTSFFLLLTGCANITIPTNANTAFRNYTLCLFQEEVAANTINLHYSLKEPEKYGITDSPITFGSFNFSESASLAAIENWNNALHKFSYNTLSKENKLTYDILSYYFETAAQDVAFYLYEEPLSPITGIHAQLPVLLAEYQFSDSEDVETYLSLLQTLPEYFDSIINFEQQKAATGLFMCDTVADDVIEQCRAFISMGDNNYLLSTFEERVSNVKGIPEKTKLELYTKNKNTLDSKILPSYEKLISAINDLKNSNSNSKGLFSLPEGRNYYAHLVRTSTGSSKSIKEMQELIENQIATDLMDTQILLKEHKYLLEETASISQSPDSILETLEHKISNTFPSSATVNVEIKYVPNALEEYLSPAFYLIPSIDNYAENVIYINQSYSMEDISLFTTLAHEGYPGHLYQTTYYASTNPDPIRTLLNFEGYVEGWATYAEMCSYYLSSLEKPLATFLQKNNSIILGLYATADIGIHYDGWDYEDTASFFNSYGITDEATLKEIYDLILGDPANYLKYYIGYIEILELKKELIKEMGGDFSQKEFHQKLLDIGPAPFEIIRKYMDISFG